MTLLEIERLVRKLAAAVSKPGGICGKPNWGGPAEGRAAIAEDGMGWRW